MASYCNVYRFATSASCMVLFLGLGIVETLIGPTLLDRASYIGTTLTDIAYIFFVRGAGYIVGGTITGALGDRFKFHTHLLLFIALLWCIVAAIAQAVSYSFVMVCFMIFLYELGSGGIDNGVHKVVLKVWKKRAGPYFQLIDFCYAIGAFTAPLLAQPFLVQQQDCNTTTISCNDSMLDPVNGSWCDDVKCWLETCTDSNSTSHLHNVINNCTDWSFLPLSLHVPRFAWAYVIAVVPWLCALLPLAFISATTENFRCVSSCLTPSHTLSSLNTDTIYSPPQSSTPSSGRHAMGFHKLGIGTARTAVIYFIAFLLISIYYGLSCGYGGLLFTFAVETLHFTKMEATNLNSLFYGAFAAGSLASIILVILKVPLGLLMILNVTGSLASTLLMVTYPSNPTLIWLGTGGLGASMASIYGTTYSWLTGQVPMTGMGTAVLIMAVSVADMTHATILGALLEHATPYLLLYYALGDVLVSCVLVAALLGTAHLWKSAEVVVAMKTTCGLAESSVSSNVDTVDEKLSYQCGEHAHDKRSKVILELTSEPYRSPMGVLCSP